MFARKVGHHSKFIKIVILCLLFVLVLTACSSTTDIGETKSTQTTSVVASTSWVAMIAKAAGAENITILAPIELRHPPEYDFKPSDIEKIQQADYIVLAGYEPFMKKLLETVEVAEEKKLQVSTQNTPDHLKEQVQQLAKTWGTVEKAKRWEVEMDAAAAKIAAEAERLQVVQQKAVVQSHMVPMAQYFGYEVVAEFSDELSPVKIAELVAMKPDLIIDNYHNVQGKPMEEVAQIPRVELRNFPSAEHDSIQALLLDNAAQLGMQVE